MHRYFNVGAGPLPTAPISHSECGYVCERTVDGHIATRITVANDHCCLGSRSHHVSSTTVLRLCIFVQRRLFGSRRDLSSRSTGKCVQKQRSAFVSMTWPYLAASDLYRDSCFKKKARSYFLNCVYIVAEVSPSSSRRVCCCFRFHLRLHEISGKQTVHCQGPQSPGLSNQIR